MIKQKNTKPVGADFIPRCQNVKNITICQLCNADDGLNHHIHYKPLKQTL